jgi:hypothetical protein
MANERKLRGGRIAAGVFCVAVALLAFLMSLPAPGLGWIVAAGALVLTGVLTRWIGKSFASAVLAISVAHLLTLGPLSPLTRHTLASLPGSFAVIFIIIPVLVALIPLVIPNRR